MSQMIHIQRGRAATVLIAIGILSLAAAYIWLHLITPSDGVYLEPDQAVWRATGVVVTSLYAQPEGLRNGDLLVAVDGRSLEAWAQTLFVPAPRPQWQYGQTVIYRVVRDGLDRDVAVTLGPYPLGLILAKNWGVFYALVTELIALFVFLRRPDDPAARVLLISASSGLGSTVWVFGLQISDLTGAIGFWLFQILTLGGWLFWYLTMLHFILIVAQPSAHQKQQVWLIRVLYITPYALFPIYLAFIWLRSASMLDWLRQWERYEYLGASVYVVITVFTLIRSYKVSTDIVIRKKISWIVFAFAVTGSTALIFYILPKLFGYPSISSNLMGVLALPLPISLAVAVLRYHLFDIDVIIRRTLIYSSVTGILALIYFGSVIVLQLVFHGITDNEQDQFVTVLSTLAITAIFIPLRRSVQNVIDRRFYRRKYNAEQVLAAFGETARKETDLEQMKAQLLQVVQETMQPVYASLWLQKNTPWRK
jgi:two-component system, NarL family, sensor kinase